MVVVMALVVVDRGSGRTVLGVEGTKHNCGFVWSELNASRAGSGGGCFPSTVYICLFVYFTHSSRAAKW